MRLTPSVRPSEERVKDFQEVTRGFTSVEAATEAARCLQCANAPCEKACPVHIPIPKFIKAIRENDPSAAYRVLREKSLFPGVCGRVCPQEDLCEGHCVLNRQKMPINIGKLERFGFDVGCNHEYANGRKGKERTFSGARVAVVGSGPAGLSGAYTLACQGYSVSVFESLHEFGGVLRYGIPEFRLPKKVVDVEIEELRNIGVAFFKDILIGKTLTLEDLFKDGYGAILIASGAGLPKVLNLPGENLNGVYSANEFLFRVNFMKAYLFPEFHTPIHIGNDVVVIGGGNVAFDCARVARRLGASVTIAYRRTREHMPARIEEIRNAVEEGISIREYLSPAVFEGESGVIRRIVFKKTRLVDQGGRRPDFIETEERIDISASTVIVAIGQDPNRLLPDTEGLALNGKGMIQVDGQFMTSRVGVFAAGDIISGAATVIAAMDAGTQAAQAIARFLRVAKER